ncbi:MULTISPECIES: TrkH family potassium uptake protein [Anaerococcus]|uniref:TrkH family potassium uptake protein n=1 Tax=Anaerococcus TaxID=165779 RepID=UPI001AE6C4D2|nr:MULTISPECIES: TrkH family potassium uptake protein [Anaerococcus]MBP2069892.1 trk system potassium uptake protein TrkH [Anaerococcus nagyae]MDU3211453.1 TrkH family potassium uptake protein [Anaerococcus sp.]
MKKEFILNSLARLNMLFAGMMLFPFLVGIIYKEPLRYLLDFFIPALIIFLSGYILYEKIEFKKTFNTKDALTLVAICWLVYSIFGAIPLYLYPGDFNTFFDAFFESVAGFSTTGATIARDVESLPNSIIFWRSFAQFIGGLGIISLTVSILPKQSKKSTMIMKAESVGPTFGKITPKVADQSKVLYTIYISMTLITIILLSLGDLDLFDSIIYGLGAAGTGGFANRDLSVGYYNSTYTEIVLAIAMFMFSINFNIYYMAFFKRSKNFYKSEELKWYSVMLITSILLIFINTFSMYEKLGRQLVDVVFAVTSISSTTGYVGSDTSTWPIFSRVILVGLMYVGGMAGSTAGGLKMSRLVLLVKSSVNQFRMMINPNRITVVEFEHKTVDDKLQQSVMSYFIIHILIFFILLAIVAIDINNFLEAFTAVATTYNGLGQFGEAQSFYELREASKFVLSIAMLLGRLEIYPLLLLFTPSTYKRI